MTFFKTHSQLFLHFQHSPNLDPKYLFKKKVPRPNRCRMSLPFLHRHMSLIPPLRHLDSHFSYHAKGPSMSCDRQRQKSEFHMTFFKTHSQLFLHFQHSPNLDPKYLFKKKVPRPNRCRMSLPFLHRHMSLIPPLRHLDSHFSYHAKGPSMSCDRQRQKSESA